MTARNDIDGDNQGLTPTDDMDGATEVFCDRCAAGVDSDEHHTNCVVPGFALDGESAPPAGTGWTWRECEAHPETAAELIRQLVEDSKHSYTVDQIRGYAKTFRSMGLAEETDHLEQAAIILEQVTK